MDQQHPNPFKEKIIEIVGEINTEKEDQSQGQQQSYDQLIPRPAFQIDLNNQNLTEEEREAMSYLLAVRSQKQSIFSAKVIKQSSIDQKIFTSQLKTELNGQRVTKNEIQNQLTQIESYLNEWGKEHISNWRCVVSNMQFIHKNKKPNELFRQKWKEQILFQQPEVNKITKNKWLNLPQIEELLIDLSNLYCEILQNRDNTHNQKHYYHIWIYSLLALHQSYASYTNFQALASINACIQLQFKTHIKSISENTFPNKQQAQTSIIQWLATLLILKQVFKQHYLRKYLKLLKQMQMV